MTYHYKTSKDQEDIGFIAQEVEALFPQTVAYGENGKLGLSYDHFGVIAIKAIQELHTALLEKEKSISNLREKLEAAQDKNELLEDRLDKIESMLFKEGRVDSAIDNEDVILLTDAQLTQNQPNPFNEQTTINYFIPEQTEQAVLIITDLKGQVIKELNISRRGEGNVTLAANTLSVGTYQYSLVLDGQLTATKQMVLTRN
ncbi:MAG: tail fiber domain-containing protein [Bacteroidota bacterium]